MKISLKTLLLLLPIVLWALFIGYLKLQQSGRNSTFPDIDRISWGEGEKQLTAKITQEIVAELELHQYVITATDKRGKELLRKSVTIDLDMGGAGFVSAMQADSDSEYEIVVVTSRKVPRKSDYYLDYAKGEIEKKPLSDLDPKAIQHIRNWFTYNAPNPFAMGYFLVPTLLYYILFFPVAWLIRKLIPRKTA